MSDKSSDSVDVDDIIDRLLEGQSRLHFPLTQFPLPFSLFVDLTLLILSFCSQFEETSLENRCSSRSQKFAI
jgi:hypothetical protein